MKKYLNNLKKKLKLKGFTLIELLAVLVILVIIMAIATPIILGIIEDSRRSADKITMEQIVDSADFLYSASFLDGELTSKFDGITNVYDDLIFSGTEPDRAEVYIKPNGQIYFEAEKDGICYTKTYDSDEIIVSERDDCLENVYNDPTEYTITISEPVGGTLMSNVLTATHGTKILLDIVADSNYDLAKITYNGIEISNNSFIMPNYDITIDATFKRNDEWLIIENSQFSDDFAGFENAKFQTYSSTGYTPSNNGTTGMNFGASGGYGNTYNGNSIRTTIDTIDFSEVQSIEYKLVIERTCANACQDDFYLKIGNTKVPIASSVSHHYPWDYTVYNGETFTITENADITNLNIDFAQPQTLSIYGYYQHYAPWNNWYGGEISVTLEYLKLHYK